MTTCGIELHNEYDYISPLLHERLEAFFGSLQDLVPILGAPHDLASSVHTIQILQVLNAVRRHTSDLRYKKGAIAGR
jgi:hypothetical protein